jgi:hypothetical protein
MSVRILEVKRANAGRAGDGFGQQLGAGRGMLDLESPEPSVRAVHVAHDDGHVLEPAIVAPGVGGRGAPGRAQILGELQVLLAQLEPHHPNAGAGEPLQAVVARPACLLIAHDPKVEHMGVELHRAVHVAHGHPHHRDRQGPRGRLHGGHSGLRHGTLALPWVVGLLRVEAGGKEQREDREPWLHAPTPAGRTASRLSARAPMRSSRWSPTRSALAMIVRAGFTAPLEGKKLPSTT